MVVAKKDMASADMDVSRDPLLVRAASVLAAGGSIIYPTETFYALGACVGSASALSRVIAIKGRPQSKPLPVIIGNMLQLGQVMSPAAQAWDGFATAARLMELFWPGPLSVIVPGKSSLPSQVMDLEGMVSVRLTPHPQARALCLLAKAPLAASSANLSGEPAASDLACVSQAVAMAADMVVAGDPPPSGGQPSTLVLPGAKGRLCVLRPGALEISLLEQAGFTVEPVGQK